VNDRRTDPETGQRMRFSSAILPPWARKTPQVSEVLPLLYLHGLSSGDFVPALGQFLGSSAGLSSSTLRAIQRFKDWLSSHTRQLLAAAVLLAGSYMVISGILRLLG
jgi:hypothetical protein